MSKAGIRLDNISKRQLKTSYRGLSDKQKKYIKAKELYDQTDRELTRFYKNAKRTESGSVDFLNIGEDDLDFFEYVNKQHEKAYKVMSKYGELIDIESTLDSFRQINLHSCSY